MKSNKEEVDIESLQKEVNHLKLQIEVLEGENSLLKSNIKTIRSIWSKSVFAKGYRFMKRGVSKIIRIIKKQIRLISSNK